MDNPAPTPPPAGGAADTPNFIARSVSAMLRRTRRSLSPWVQRLIASPAIESASPAADATPPVGTGESQTRPTTTPTSRAPATFTATATERLLTRVQRLNANSTVWRGNIGSLDPTHIDNFASGIAERFPDTSDKFQLKPLGGEDAEPPEPLPLINGASLQAEEEKSGEPERPAWSYFEQWPPAPVSPAASEIRSDVAPPSPVAPRWPELGAPAPAPRKAAGRPLSRVEEVFAESPKETKRAAQRESSETAPETTPSAPAAPVETITPTTPIRRAAITEEPTPGGEGVSRPVAPASLEAPVSPETTLAPARESLPLHKPEPIEARPEASASASEAEPSAPHWPELGAPAPQPLTSAERIVQPKLETPAPRGSETQIPSPVEQPKLSTPASRVAPSTPASIEPPSSEIETHPIPARATPPANDLPLTTHRPTELIQRAPETPEPSPENPVFETPELPLTQPRVKDILRRSTETHLPEPIQPDAQTFNSPPIQREALTPPRVSAPRPEAQPAPESEVLPLNVEKRPSTPHPSEPPVSPSEAASPARGAPRAASPSPARDAVQPTSATEKNILARAISNLNLPLTASWPLSVRRMIQRLFAPREESAPPEAETNLDLPTADVAQPAPRPMPARRVSAPANRPIGEMALNFSRLEPVVAQRAVRVNLMAGGWRFKTAPSEARADLHLISRAVTGLNQSGGRPLQRETRVRMENTLGRDFSNVRVHTAQLAPLNVQAATQGDDVYFDEGQNNFDSPEGLALLGHELTHVAQTGNAPSKPVARMAAPDLAPTHSLMRVADDEAQAESVERNIFTNAHRPLPLSGPVAVPRVSTVARMSSTVVQRAQESGTPEEENNQGQNFLDNLDDAVPPGGNLPPSGESPGDIKDTLKQTVTETAEAAVEAREDLPEKEKVDLDNLARQIYPLLKRLLAVERERSSSR